MSSFRFALLGVPLVAAVACMDTSSLTGGDPSGSSGTSGTTPGGASDVEIQPSALALPDSDCGKETRKTFVVLNRSTRDALEYKVTSPDPAFSIASGAEGTVAPGGAATVEVVATPNANVELSTTLIVEANGRSNVLPVKMRGHGATVELSQTAIDFGDARKENGGETKVLVKNAGDKPLEMSFQSESPTSDFEITPAAINVPSDSSVEITARLKAGVSTATPLTGRFLSKASAICGEAPTLELRGRRITTDVTIDVVDWGDVACKSTPADRDATIKNYGPSAFTYTASVAGDGFILAQGATGAIPGGTETAPTIAKVKVHATPGTTPGQKEGSLSVVGAQLSATNKIRAFVYGLVIASSPPSATLISNGTTETKRTFSLSNSGKFGGSPLLTASYQVTGAGFRTANASGTFYLFGGTSTKGSVDVVFKAAQAGTVNGNLFVNGPVCSQQTISLSGLGP